MQKSIFSDNKSIHVSAVLEFLPTFMIVVQWSFVKVSVGDFCFYFDDISKPKDRRISRVRNLWKCY